MNKHGGTLWWYTFSMGHYLRSAYANMALNVITIHFNSASKFVFTILNHRFHDISLIITTICGLIMCDDTQNRFYNVRIIWWMFAIKRLKYIYNFDIDVLIRGGANIWWMGGGVQSHPCPTHHCRCNFSSALQDPEKVAFPKEGGDLVSMPRMS